MTFVTINSFPPQVFEQSLFLFSRNNEGNFYLRNVNIHRSGGSKPFYVCFYRVAMAEATLIGLA